MMPYGPKNPAENARWETPSKRMMVFVDGENLVYRYQNMVNKGYIPRDDLAHVKDTYVWGHSFPVLARNHEILRLTYYTYVVGDENRVDQIRDELKEQNFSKHTASLLPNQVSPCVFKKDRRSRSGKGVDIQMCVDILGHVYRGNVDAILIISGDGDFEPLIEEIKRVGVQVYLSALSDGLNPNLSRIVDQFYCLDGTTWKERPRNDEP